MAPAAGPTRMRVLHGKEAGERIREMIGAYDRLVVDVGAGDGRFATAYARRHPETLVVGLDTAKDKLVRAARRAGRKPERGGLANLLYVLASAEQPPAELAGRASEVHVILPWGRLLRGLLTGDEGVLEGLARLAAQDAVLRVVLNGGALDAAAPGASQATTEHAWRELAPRLGAHGIVLLEARMLTRDEVRALASSWAKRLHHARDHPRFLYLEATVHRRPPDTGLVSPRPGRRPKGSTPGSTFEGCPTPGAVRRVLPAEHQPGEVEAARRSG